MAAKLDEMQRSAEKGSTHLDLIEVIHAVHWPFANGGERQAD